MVRFQKKNPYLFLKYLQTEKYAICDLLANDLGGGRKRDEQRRARTSSALARWSPTLGHGVSGTGVRHTAHSAEKGPGRSRATAAH